jgi:hypothetical protein
MIGFLAEVYTEGGVELGVPATTRAHTREVIYNLPARLPAAIILAQYYIYPYTQSLY